tara:strand:- start:43 stop:243 length:201 start_codon:yes stop_codon:yes gene_type:complete
MISAMINKNKDFSTILLVLMFPFILKLNKGYNGLIPIFVNESINKWETYPIHINKANPALINEIIK